MTFAAPTRDIKFVLKNVVGIDALAETGAYDDLSDDIVDAVLGEAGRLATEVVAPLNWVGDQQGSLRQDDGSVKTPDGFKDAYKQIVDGGWGGVPFDPEYGGQGLPKVLGLAVQEFWTSANMAFSLCPLLSRGAIEAISAHGTEEQKAIYLEKLVSGQWTGTMNLTEPQAGSDVGALRSKAEKQADGTYKISGTKIFITWGEHDMTDNIIHLVLARLPDAPAGTRGISLFIVPKFLVNEDGSLGERNDVQCVSVEHKLGIHASPTCVMSFGDNGGATGYLIGQENRGMACMFTMMNDARLGVGLEGVAIAERAYQQALEFAQERKQGKPVGRQHEDVDMIPIIEHPDVRRMLMTMKSHVEAARGVCYAATIAGDMALALEGDDAKADARGRLDLLTPVAKGWSTDMGVDMTSIGVQIHGGMGFVEETGAAQHYRDSRIAPIYEGTNGIQAIDLVTRKLPLDGGNVVRMFIAEIEDLADQAKKSNDSSLGVIGSNLSESVAHLATATEWLLNAVKSAPNDALAGATPYLKLFGTVAGGFFLAKGALAAHNQLSEGDSDYLRSRIAMAEFFAENVLTCSAGLVGPSTRGAELLFALTPDQLAS